jgi:uncharacterized membrane protein
MERNVSVWERGVSIAAGALLVAAGIKARGRIRSSLLTGGAGLALRGLTGYCPVNQLIGRTVSDDPHVALAGSRGVKLCEKITIKRSARDLYNLWRKFEDLPGIFSHLDSVRVLDDRRSHWAMTGPAGVPLEWDAEIINDEAPNLIAWKSLEGADVVSAGSVHFKERTRGGQPETDVTVSMQYDAPGGKAGSALAWLAGQAPTQTLRSDLASLKQWLEHVDHVAHAN